MKIEMDKRVGFATTSNLKRYEYLEKYSQLNAYKNGQN